MRGDLHVHSTASDGTLSPRELVELAIQRDLAVLAITDHDSVDAVAEALEAAENTTLTVIPALELSSSHEGRDAHILGYFVRHDDPTLRQHLVELRAARLERAQVMVEMLKDAGFAVTLEQVLALTAGGAVGRSHVARALVDAGHASDIRDAFTRLIGRDGPFYVAKSVRSAADAIAVIRNAGGIAVLAHPGVGGHELGLAPLRDAGLGGVEAYHADHTPEQRVHFAQLAADLGLLVTGGSDFHGHSAPNPSLGEVAIPEAVFDELLAWGAAHA